MTKIADAAQFAARMKALGFTVYLAKSQTYGFITDDAQRRVLSFSMNDGSSLSGNYGPPSRESGTGWRLDRMPEHLLTAQDVADALYSIPPSYCGRGWKRFSSVVDHMAAYGLASGFTKFEEEV